MPNDPHEEPATPYELMLDVAELDCSRYACWNPAEAFVVAPNGERTQVCAGHSQAVANRVAVAYGYVVIVPLER